MKENISIPAMYLSFILLFKLPWSFFKTFYGITKSSYQDVVVSNLIPNLSRIPVIISQFYNKFLFYGHWNILWVTLIIFIVIILVKKLYDKNIFIILTMLFLNMAGLAFFYYASESYGFLLDGTTLNRNSLLFIPVVVFLLGYSLDLILKGIKQDG